jgi:hypothetical protein
MLCFYPVHPLARAYRRPGEGRGGRAVGQQLGRQDGGRTGRQNRHQDARHQGGGRGRGDDQPPWRPDPGQGITRARRHDPFGLMFFSKCGVEQLPGARRDGERNRVPEPGELI